MSIFLGIDCGATSLRIGFVQEDGLLLAHSRLESPLKFQPERLAEIVQKEVSLKASQFNIDVSRIEGIGIGLPGPLDLKKGLILPSSNLANIAPINIKQQFENIFNPTTVIDRDTIVALLGEAWQGGAHGLREVVMLTLGTGVGGAFMVKGEIDKGMDDKAGEIGHMFIEGQPEGIIRKGAVKCGLGHLGCLEALINSTEDLELLGRYLGFGLANIVDIFNPEKIIIGGGKINLGDFIATAVETMKKNGMRPAVDEVRVEYAKLKDMSGIFGAARLAMIGGLP